MNNINSVVITGNIVHDIGEKDFSYVGDKAKLNVTLAVNKDVKRNGEWVSEGMFFEVAIWGKQAEGLKPYLTKGKGLVVEGRLSQDRWEKDGQKKSKVYITANNVQFMGGGKGKPGNTDSASATSDFPEDIPFDTKQQGEIEF